MDENGPNWDSWQPDNEIALRWAVLRITPGTHDTSDPDFITNPGLTVHANPGHVAVGITEVKIQKSTGRIFVLTDGATNGAVLPGKDETAAAKGLDFGATGGPSGLGILCSRWTPSGVVVQNLASQAVYDSVASPLLNVWFVWISPLVRGIGLPSKADRALSRLDLAEARLDALEGG